MSLMLFMLTSFILTGFLKADKAPVLIWSNDKTIVLPHPLSGHTVSRDSFVHQYIDVLTANKKLNVAVFLQDKLNLADISRNVAVYDADDETNDVFKQLKAIMSSLSVAQLPSVISPVSALADLKKQFAPEATHLLQHPYQVNDLQLDAAGHNLIIVQLPETKPGETAYRSSLQTTDEILGSVTSQLKALAAPFAAVYTASRSPTGDGQGSRTGRQLLGAEGGNGTEMLMGYIEDEFFMYAENVTVITNSTTHHLQVDHNSWTTDHTNCTNSTTEQDCLIELSYNIKDLTDLKNFKLNLTLNKKTSGYWHIKKFQMSYDTEPQLMTLYSGYIDETPLGFSYHCYQPPPMIVLNNTDAAGVSLVFQSLQIQAFGVKNSKFGYYNDCVGFFTIPIWMGIITTAVLMAVLLFGITMLLDIKTMDRYDDPKGKTITVTATD